MSSEQILLRLLQSVGTASLTYVGVTLLRHWLGV